VKKDFTKYVDKCLTCQRVKAKRQYLVGELKLLEMPAWK